MASSIAAGRFSIALALMVLIQLGLVSVSVAGRPCKTLFISSYTVSWRTEPFFRPNPNRDVVDINLPTSDPSSSSPRFVTIFTTSFRNTEFIPEVAFPLEIPAESSKIQQQQEAPAKDDILGFFDLSSMRDRTKDILSVVISLLFGVGCGALTAVTMYLAWYVLTNGGGQYHQESDDEYDFIESPKKNGYVKIPAADASPAPTKA